MTATRILYHTRTADNTDTLASGVVLVPYGTPPKDGWPLLAWSHGTSGVARVCAPSLMTSLFYNWEGLYAYVILGYAVGEFQVSSGRSSSWFPLTQNLANRAMVRSTIS